MDTILKYNLQFFAEENSDDNTTVTDTSESAGDGNNSRGDEVNVQAFAEIISEKDKKLEELETEVKKLKKSNAEMLLRINSAKSDDFDFDKAIMSFDTRALTN